MQKKTVKMWKIVKKNCKKIVKSIDKNKATWKRKLFLLFFFCL